jgi:hypothetical protein
MRPWEQAERVARAERDQRDPVKIKLQKIAEQEATKAAKEGARAKITPAQRAFMNKTEDRTTH